MSLLCMANFIISQGTKPRFHAFTIELPQAGVGKQRKTPDPERLHALDQRPDFEDKSPYLKALRTGASSSISAGKA